MCINTTNQQAGNPRLNRAIKHFFRGTSDIFWCLHVPCTHRRQLIYIYTTKQIQLCKLQSLLWFRYLVPYTEWTVSWNFMTFQWAYSRAISTSSCTSVVEFVTPLQFNYHTAGCKCFRIFGFEQYALYVLESYDHFNYSCKWFVVLMNDESLSSSRYTFRPFVEIKHDPTSLE